MFMILSFEPVCLEIERLFLQRLSEYIEKINKKHNDGIILKNFENKTMYDESLKQPTFVFDYITAKCNDKDRILENVIFELAFDFKIQEKGKQKILIFWRYMEAIQMMFKEEETSYPYKIAEINKNKIIIHVIIGL